MISILASLNMRTVFIMTTMKPDQFCMKKRKTIMKRGMRTSLEKVRERKYLDLFHHLTARLGPGSLLLPCELTSLLILEGGTFFQVSNFRGQYRNMGGGRFACEENVLFLL